MKGTQNKLLEPTQVKLVGFCKMLVACAVQHGVPPSASLGGNAAVEQRTPDFPSAPLRGEPGVRDRCPSGTAQLPHYAKIDRI